MKNTLEVQLMIGTSIGEAGLRLQQVYTSLIHQQGVNIAPSSLVITTMFNGIPISYDKDSTVRTVIEKWEEARRIKQEEHEKETKTKLITTHDVYKKFFDKVYNLVMPKTHYVDSPLFISDMRELCSVTYETLRDRVTDNGLNQ